MKKLLRRLDPFRDFDFDLLGSSLSARVLWLTVGIILLVEVMILLPNLGQERQDWLWQRVTQAHLAAFTLTRTDNQTLDAPVSAALLHLAGVESLRLIEPGQSALVLPGGPVMPRPDRSVDLAHETLLYSAEHAALRLLGLGARQIEVVAPSPLQPGAMLDIVVDGDALSAYLRNYALHAAALSVIVALVTGLLVFSVLDRLLVRPMRIMTASIVGFRKDPEQAASGDLGWLAGRGEDEIAVAARELMEMQEALRADLWRNARLAAVWTAVAKISHDLRNILSSALLVANRLQQVADPQAQRAADTLITAVERAAQLVGRTVDFTREGPPPLTRSAVALRGLVEEAAATARPEGAGFVLDNQVSEALVLALDRTHIYRVLVNLMRNAAEAGATRISVIAGLEAGVPRMELRDNGPGLPEKVRENLFKPFTGSGRHGGTGLGLVIARDLVRAHGGELVLAQTGKRGTVFAMELAERKNETRRAEPSESETIGLG
jgi:signal transduction histidine kinase